MTAKMLATTQNINSNKSAAGMQHTPPRNTFNAKKVILKLDLFMQSLKKIGKEIPKTESEKPRTSDGGNGNHSVSLPTILIKIKVD